MASNHTKHTEITDALAVGHLWKHLKKSTTVGVTPDQATHLAKVGLMSVSNILEQAILDNNKNLKKSNATGEDFDDGSDAKYTRARNIHNGNGYQFCGCGLSNLGLRTKKGTLRIFITHVDSRNNKQVFHMYKIPYDVWSTRKNKTGIRFGFSSVDGSPTPVTEEKWGEFKVKTIKQLAS